MSMENLGKLVLILLALALGKYLLGDGVLGGVRVQPPVVVENTVAPPPPLITDPPLRTTSQEPPTTAWTCPGEEVENGGCLVMSTTDVPANACVDYDPRGNDHPVGGYDTIDTDATRQRVRFTQPGQIVLSGGRATIYTNNNCPPYT